MKKTILVGVLAAMMLFAFTACEQSMPTYKNADYLTVSQIAPFIEGQEFDAANFEVTVHYTDGSTSTVTGNGIVTLSGTLSTTNNKVTAKVGTLTADYTATVISKDECEITDVVFNKTTASVELDEDATATVGITSQLNGIKSVTYTYGEVSYVDENPVAADFDLTGSISAEDQKTVGEKEVVVTVSDAATDEVVAEVTVTVTVKDPNDDGTVDPVAKDDVDALKVTWTITGVDNKTRTVEGPNVTVYAGEKLAYAITGTSTDQLEDQEDCTLVAQSDYTISHDTLTSALSTAQTSGFTAAQITKTTGENQVQPFTATVTFKSNYGAPNYEAGSVAPVTLTVTVMDNLLNSAVTGTWIYDPNADGTADAIPATSAITINPAAIRLTVNSVGGNPVVLCADKIKDKATFSVEDLNAATNLVLDFTWKVADGSYSNVGTGNVSIGITK